MGKTYRAARPNPACNIPDGRSVKEATLRRFTKAWRKITHHQERRAVRMATLNELQEAL